MVNYLHTFCQSITGHDAAKVSVQNKKYTLESDKGANQPAVLGGYSCTYMGMTKKIYEGESEEETELEDTSLVKGRAVYSPVYCMYMRMYKRMSQLQ